MRLIVCPSREAAALSAERRPSHVLGLGSPGAEPPRIGGGAELRLVFHDIAEPRPGLVGPDEEAIAAMLAFGRSWDGGRPLLVHCQLGISRSPAAAFALACQRRPAWPEAAIAARLRAASPCATPNPLVVALADGLLARAGRMTAAAAAGLGRGADYAPYRSFDLSLEPWEAADGSLPVEPCPATAASL